MIFALDVAPKRDLSAVADDTGKHALIVHFALPTELGRLIALAERSWSPRGAAVQIAMEPTSSYNPPILEDRARRLARDVPDRPQARP